MHPPSYRETTLQPTRLVQGSTRTTLLGGGRAEADKLLLLTQPGDYTRLRSRELLGGKGEERSPRHARTSFSEDHSGLNPLYSATQ